MADGGLHKEEAARIRAAVAADARAARGEFLFRPPPPLDGALRALLADPRDAPILYLALNILCTTVPAALALLWLRPASNLPGLAYLVANYALYLQRFMLMLHFSEHRRLFRKGGCGGEAGAGRREGGGGGGRQGAVLLPLRGAAMSPHGARTEVGAVLLIFLLPSLCSKHIGNRHPSRAHQPPPRPACLPSLPSAGCGALNAVVPLLLCPFFGVPSGMYRLHHCIMHHTVGRAGRRAGGTGRASALAYSGSRCFACRCLSAQRAMPAQPAMLLTPLGPTGSCPPAARLAGCPAARRRTTRRGGTSPPQSPSNETTSCTSWGGWGGGSWAPRTAGWLAGWPTGRCSAGSGVCALALARRGGVSRRRGPPASGCSVVGPARRKIFEYCSPARPCAPLRPRLRPLPLAQLLAAVLGPRLGGAALLCLPAAALGRAGGVPGHRVRVPGGRACAVGAEPHGHQVGLHRPLLHLILCPHVRQLVSGRRGSKGRAGWPRGAPG